VLTNKLAKINKKDESEEVDCLGQVFVLYFTLLTKGAKIFKKKISIDRLKH
jgi:hypothetical protein